MSKLVKLFAVSKEKPPAYARGLTF
jgi:hypothetical protein